MPAQTGGMLDVYRAAEIIRLENISDNVAGEDIIEKLVALAGSAFVPIEFNNRAFASEGQATRLRLTSKPIRSWTQ